MDNQGSFEDIKQLFRETDRKAGRVVGPEESAGTAMAGRVRDDLPETPEQ